MDRVVYRIASPQALGAAAEVGAYEGEAFDKADGFIHASTRAQLEGTLLVHYADADRVAVAEIDADALGESLKWEPSRGGELFPHVYGTIAWTAVRKVYLLSKQDGSWRLPQELCDE